MNTYTRQTLPENDNVNPYAFSLALNAPFFVRKGKMIAHYGDLRFESLGTSAFSEMVRKSFGAPGYAGEFSVVTGQGKLLLGDYGRNLASFDLEDGNLTVRAANVLGFDKALLCQECVVDGYLTLTGTGRFVGSSNGPVHFMEPPVRVDPEAILGWADTPCPALHYDYAAISNVLGMLGQVTGATRTGEEKQVSFTGKGTVLVQSGEEQVQSPALLRRILGLLPGVSAGDLPQVQAAIAARLRER